MLAFLVPGSLLGLIKLLGGHFVKIFWVHRERSTWLRKEFCLVSFQENFAEVKIFELQLQTERLILFRPILLVSPNCACSMRKISRVTGKRCERRPGFGMPVHDFNKLHIVGLRFLCMQESGGSHFY